MGTDAPVLETERLILRGHTIGDESDCAAMWADRSVTRFLGNRAFDPEESRTRLLRYAGLWRLLGFGYWAARDKVTGRYAGDVGFADYRRSILPPLEYPEIGWVFATWAQGQGLAREAVRAVLSWADHSLKAPTTLCIIAPDHERSIRLAQDFGYVKIEEIFYHSRAMVRFDRPNPF